jgi:hypothetical protein
VRKGLTGEGDAHDELSLARLEMCCENCPRHTSCEEEGHLNELCCVSCPDYDSCHGKDSQEEDPAGLEGGFDEV